MQSQDVPNGFIVQPHHSGSLTITYRSRGINPILFISFLSIWLVVAGRILIVVLPHFGKFLLQFNSNNQLQLTPMFLENWPGALLITSVITIFILVYFYLLFIVLKKAFGVTIFEVSPDILLITRKLFGFKRLQKVLALDMVKLKQQKDGSRRRYSFFWSLWIYAPKKVGLLKGEMREKSDWLGEFLSDYYKIEFQKFPERR